jgi:hypothetical protein
VRTADGQDFFAVDRLAVLFAVLLAVLFVVLFLAAGAFAVDAFFAGALAAVLFFAVDFFAGDVVDFLLAGAFAVDVFFAVVDAFFVVDVFLAGAFVVVFAAVDFDALEDFFAALLADLAAPEVLFFAALLVADLDGVAFFATSAAFFAGAELAAAPTAARAGAVAFFATSEAFGSLGSFFEPDTTAFRSAPAVNFGIAVFFALILSPVRGLRTHRASRTRFSNEPKPVMATFSPRATSRVMVSRTDSSACCACFRLPSKRVDSVSIS